MKKKSKAKSALESVMNLLYEASEYVTQEKIGKDGAVTLSNGLHTITIRKTK